MVLDTVIKTKWVRKKDGREFNKRSYFKNTDETCGSDYGVSVSGDSVQHYGYGLDRSAWIQGCGRSMCFRICKLKESHHLSGKQQ